MSCGLRTPAASPRSVQAPSTQRHQQSERCPHARGRSGSSPTTGSASHRGGVEALHHRCQQRSATNPRVVLAAAKAVSTTASMQLSSAHAAGCGCWVPSPPSGMVSRCRCRGPRGGCWPFSRCAPVRTTATRWPAGSGPTCHSRRRGQACGPRYGRCAAPWARTRWRSRGAPLGCARRRCGSTSPTSPRWLQQARIGWHSSSAAASCWPSWTRIGRGPRGRSTRRATPSCWTGSPSAPRPPVTLRRQCAGHGCAAH